ncbi:adenosine deaminase [Polynucleobacter meluiroseus]|uniref:adenosine deaminase n=1 Tax=Polynucleobacter meluiroseus TaxID=1938814 RepID=A0A240E1U6_9BURK|nr:adenosine deaminase [Polynucleobacter meluiroseus]SNX29197.1 adenosine deaminase [Polynucleobacter meluiroseus]
MTFNMGLFKRLICLMVLMALIVPLTHGAEQSEIKTNYRATEKYYQSMMSPSSLPIAQLQQFIHYLPKGGDIHHHYVGALYAETYLDWVEKKGYCIHRTNFQIETQVVKGSEDATQECISASLVRADTLFYTRLLQHWSDKDFDNAQPADLQFFSTFAYFFPIAYAFNQEGLQILKSRAQDENLQYIETTFQIAPSRGSKASNYKNHLLGSQEDLRINEALESSFQELQQDQDFQQAIRDYVESIDILFSQINDSAFTIKAQAYALRNEEPNAFFERLYAAFVASQKSSNIVGVNIVGPENEFVSMRDYALQMKMARFLKQKFPKARLSFHAGELALGMVPPEDLRNHITQAVRIAGVERIGHGLDIVYERNFNELMQEMKQKKIAVEINLTSNEFIAKIAGQSHPIILYAKNGVPIVISSDDEGVSRGSISQEYLLYLSRYKPSYSTLKKTIYNSISYSFLSEQEKATQIQLLDDKFARFEKQIALLQ